MAKRSKDTLDKAAQKLAEQSERRTRRAAKTAGPSNLTDDTITTQLAGIFEAHADLAQAKEEMDKANGIYRNKIKAAEKLGLNKASILELVRLKTKEPGEEVTRLKHTIRYAKLMGMPIGTQLDIFADVAEEAELSPYNQGRAAAANRESSDNNPYQAGSESFAAWDKGHGDWLFDHAPKMPASNGAAAGAP